MNFFSRHKYIITALVVAGCFLLVQPAHADVASTAASLVGNIVSGIVWILGKVLVVLMYILIWVCSYNGFVTSAAVTNGWVILRDVCNMFFILILLVIAFTTVLNIEGYSWKKLLPKMLLMAVLINFSKLICGVIIDFAQVIMLTFVNGFRDIGGGNLSDMLGINQLLSMSEGVGDVSQLSIMGTYILALGYVIVSIGVIVIILFVLVMRMVMLWILVTLSPLAYLLGALPNTSKYASKWWSQFTENVVSGPILAFFIWLSFASATADVKIIQSDTPKPEKSSTEQTYFEKTSLGAGLSTAGTPEGMLKFIISIGMLIGGVMITKDLGGAAAKAVGKGMSVNNWARKKTTAAAKTAATNTGRVAAQTSLRAAGSVAQYTGNKWNEKSGGKYGESLQKTGAFAKSWGSDIRQTRKDAKVKARQKTLEKLGMKGGTMDLGKEALDTKLGRSVKGGLAMGAGALMMSNPLTAGYGAMLMGIGVGHVGGSLSSKWVGKKVKDYAATKQQNKNINAADRALRDLKAKKKDDVKSEVQFKHGKALDEIENRKSTRDKALRAVDDQEGVDVRNAINTNKSEEEINAIKQSAFEKRTAIKLDADVDIDRLQSKVDEDKLKIEADIEAKYKPNVEELNKFKEENKLVQQRDKNIQKNDSERHNNLEVENQTRISAVAMVKEKYKNHPTELKEAKLKEVTDTYENEKKKINSFYDELNSEERQKAPDTKLVDRIPKVINYAGGSIENIQPNRLTIDAMKLGSKEFIAARDSVKAVKETGNIRAFEANYWSTPTGINSQQEKFLSALAENSKESRLALQNMAEGLKKLKGSVGLEKDQNWLEGIMRGVATITDKKPETKNSYTTIIEVLDDLHATKKVEDFKPKTK